jgi:hypothetical protein
MLHIVTAYNAGYIRNVRPRILVSVDDVTDRLLESEYCVSYPSHRAASGIESLPQGIDLKFPFLNFILPTKTNRKLAIPSAVKVTIPTIPKLDFRREQKMDRYVVRGRKTLDLDYIAVPSP